MADAGSSLAPPSRDGEAAVDLEKGSADRGRGMAAGSSRREAHSDEVSPHTTTPTAAQQPQRHHHRSHERLHGMMHDDGLLHYENVTREGRSASVVRDDEGRIAFPTLVPPAVESPSLSSDALHDYGEASPNLAAGALDGRPKSISDPTNPDGSAAATGGVDIVVTGPDGKPSADAAASSSTATAATPAPPAVKRTRTRTLEGDDKLSALRPAMTRSSTLGRTRSSTLGRTRSSTLPTAPPRRNSNVTLIQELRRTSTLQWNLEEYLEHDEEPGLPNGALPASGDGAGAANVQQSQAAGQAPKARSSFWKKRKTDAASSPHTHRNFLSSQTFKRDGRLPISVKDTSHTGYLAKAVGAAVRRITQGESDDEDEHTSSTEAEPDAYAEAQQQAEMSVAAGEFERVSQKLVRQKCPQLNIVIMVIGSRGDVQPFLKIGRVLKEKYGHRVRVATHPAFRDFIEKEAGLEFFSAGGDPAELMAFMVKNPGMIPSLATVRAGDIGRRRDAMAEMFEGFWRACVDATDDPTDVRNLKLVGEKEPFIADAIIANPPSYVHVHCAEALGIPLHIMFTFPYTPTQAFPHPLANIKKSNVDPGYTNFISYPLIDMMVWQGLGDLVNNFRVKTLDLDPISMIWAPGAIYRMHVPFTYLWSPGLIPKPEDWGPEIDIGGFVFLELASSFKPPPSLEAFLAASDEKPVYIGFGSIVVDDADSFTEMIFEAVRLAGVRALVSKGWGGFGGKGDNVPDNIYMLENTPHDWLFPQVRACVIHGGAGTTAIALKCGLPIMVVPFFGDQYFWGTMLEKSKAGPKPVPYKRLTAERLAEGIQYLLGKEASAAAQTIAASIEKEGDGAENACESFVRTLRLEGQSSMRCAIFPDRVAVWQRKGSNIKLSALAAEALVDKGYMTYRNLRLIRHTEWNDFGGAGEPITAMFGSLARSFRDVISGPLSAASQIISGGKKSIQDKKARKNSKTSEKQKQPAASAASAPNHNGESSPGKSGSANDLVEADTLGEDEGGDLESEETQSSSSYQGPEKAEEGSFEDVFAAAGKSFGQSALALAMAPIELYFALCQGFHNAPRLYGDDTVRRPAHVTGIKSGLKAAGNEFVFGVYDGVTGIVLLPIRHARGGGGVHGFVRGVGMGLMGFVLKNISAGIGPFGYALKGLAKQAERPNQPTRYLRRARMAQAQREMRGFDDREWQQFHARAAQGWEAMHALYKTVQQQSHGTKTKKAADKKLTDEEAANANSNAHMLARSSGAVVPRRASVDSVFQRHHHHPHTAAMRQASLDLDEALENADLSAIVLAALRRGETLESVVRGSNTRRARQRRACRACHSAARRFGGPPEQDLNRVCREQLAKGEWQEEKEEGAADGVGVVAGGSSDAKDGVLDGEGEKV